ncbi:MFS transporter [Clostridium ljungdahlii]|uniref:Putative Na+/sugar symporter n=1 Tax=Clostridium ljungdahlii (strain ATCC 55383 / DSM 13528 / PETC) TaxID=748727 RepID=D8GKJ1_CLOLD|nr:MFS transporter [Clostridium ljungdahlii]ADK15331.1 putative Na+/sugar symporter [Clostridium ljungdahlii DSM 13528]OAA88429.1 putative symporter YjmB [Clostridium ljungdahlii DSM 13528]
MKKKKSVYTVKSLRYGVTNGFTTMMTMVTTTYWAIFLTSAVGVETAIMATILTFSSIVDMISIPICGIVLQKGRLKGGKFRPWLIIGGVLAALFRWLSFTDLGLTASGRAIWFAGTYILGYVFFNLAYSAFMGILPLMAKTPDERVSYSACRVMCNSAGKFLFSLTSVGLIAFFGRNSESTGYSMFALLLSVMAFLGFFQLFFAAKEYDVITSLEDKSGKVKDQYDASIWEMIKYTISKPFLLYLLGASCKGTIYFIITGLAAYYYTYVTGSKLMLTTFLSLSTFLMIFGSFITPFISRLAKGSRNMYILGMAVYGLCLGSAYFFGKTAISFTVVMCLGYIGYSFSHASESALYSNIVDYTKWKTGKDLKPFMMTLFSLVPKIGTTIGSAVLGFGLVAVGFQKSNVTPYAVNGIRLLMSGIPAVLSVVCIIALLLFPLTDKKVIEMQADMVKK